MEKDIDIFAMSDEDIMKMTAPPAPSGDKQVETSVATEQQEVKTEADLEIERQEQQNKEIEGKVETDPSLVQEDKTKEEEEKPKLEGEPEKPVVEGEENKTKEEKPKVEGEAQPVNYEAVYNQIMAPFKANGKTIELKSPEEAIRLMQMGANYTRQMQDLAPKKKILTMLEKNNLLDEGKLSYLIDLDKKNPDAIKNLIKESGLDPLDIDKDDKTAYTPGNHRVTNEEVNFDTVLDEVSSTPEGGETLQIINTTWDQASKEALWSSPQIMTIMHDQRKSGVYDQIASEIERRRTLGQMSVNTPFLEAYRDVGDDLVKRGLLNPKVDQTQKQRGEPLATKAATPKIDANADKVAAAAAPKAAPTKKEEVKNPLAMSDEDFLKSMSNRL